MKDPCHGCNSRNETCHSTCTSYKLWKYEKTHQNEEIKRKKKESNDVDAVLWKRKYVGKTIEKKKG